MEMIKGIYAITQPSPHLLDQVEAVLQAGIALLQYRDKQSSPAQRWAIAQQLQSRCRLAGVPLIINDDVELAYHLQADGVHLGQSDQALAAARHCLGAKAMIGVSCYNQLARAVAAQQAGADYVAFGCFFPSGTKPDAVIADTALLKQARACLGIPIVAIGGITPDNGAALLAAGADVLAVVSGIFAQPVPAQAVARLKRLFE